MEAGLYISKPEFIISNNNNNNNTKSNHNNNNNNNNNNHNNNNLLTIKTGRENANASATDNNNILIPKKKWSTCTIPSLSSLTEVGVGDETHIVVSSSPTGNGHFRSTENLSSYYDSATYDGDSYGGGGGSRRDSTEVAAMPKEEKLRTRRKSWHVGKFEKKRRKSSLFGSSINIIAGGNSNHSSGTTSPNAYDKTRRSSWWNIFVPDHWPKSKKRRSSIDFSKNTPTENIPYVRSKSRSVDHGFTSPFDLDSLRSKVEGRFENVDKLNKDTNGDSRSGSKEALSDKKMQKPPVTRTVTYKVESNDTLTSVAARFDTTPSELAILNRLPSRTVFPGQIIKVPYKRRTHRDGDDNAEGTGNSSGQDDSSESENASRSRGLSESDSRGPDEASEDDLLDNLHSASPKPGRAERIHSPSSPIIARHRTIDRFLKINVRHVTDGQGVVGGVLLVTPNAVMFDPNVSDELVIERGPESYGVIAPMELVVNAAIYHDIAHMRVANQEPLHTEGSDKPEIYHIEKKIADSSLYRPKEDRIDEDKSDKPPAESDDVTRNIPKQEQVDEDSSDATPSTVKDVNLFTDSGNADDTLDSSTKRRTQSPSSRLVNKTECSLAKDEQFPELCCKSSEESSICSCDEERDTGNAFPKAFDKDLISPNYYTKKREFILKRSDELSEKDDGSHSSDDKRTEESPMSSLSVEKAESTDSSIPHLVEAENVIKHLEARRKSSLDQHWAIPNKARSTESEMSSHEEEDEGEQHVDRICLTKPSCYDSGIDIRDPSFVPPAAVRKKSSYSDADILLSDSNEFVPPIPIKQLSKPDEETVASQKKASVSFSLEDSKDGNLDQRQQPPSKSSSTEEADKQTESKKNKMLKRLSYPIAWMEGITSDKDDKESSLPSSAESSHPSHSSSSVFSKVFSRRSSVSSFIRQQHNTRTDSTKSAGPRLDYRSMVSVEDMPELFVSFDKLIPRPARSCEDPPLYLRLRMGKPKHRKIPKTTTIMSYGKRKMRPEYWFSVPRNRVDELYKFLNLWVPHLYGDLDEKVVEERGYDLISSDTDIWDDEDDLADDKKRQRQNSQDLDLTESWEVLSMSEELRRALYANSANSLDLELFLPDLNGTTEILTEDHRKQLCKHLPARAEGYAWSLVFTTSQHGFSLNSMYRRMNRIDSPILMIIQDTDSNVFGALTSCALRVSDHFYGNGESFLFTFTPEFHAYNWTGENFYFFKGNNDGLTIGSGDGKFGIWLDADLYQGRTEPCATYGNSSLVPQEDFIVKTIECWAFL